MFPINKQPKVKKVSLVKMYWNLCNQFFKSIKNCIFSTKYLFSFRFFNKCYIRELIDTTL